MNYDKSFFHLPLHVNEGYSATVGYVFRSINLYNILKNKYTRYNAFNIKLESVSAAGVTIIPVMLHLKGLDWVNGYDTLNNYPDARVMEIVGGVVSNYLPNTNAISFRKPPSNFVDLTIFFTDCDGNFIARPGTITEIALIFSITGIDAYRVVNPQKGIRYSYQNNLSSSLQLKSIDGISIDPIDTTYTKGRIKLFKNINLRTILGNEIFDKYEKFCLVTKFIALDTVSGSSLTGFFNFSFYFSGTNLFFDTPSLTPYTVRSNVTSLRDTEPVCIGFSSGSTEIYIENTFFRPTTDIVDLTINFSYHTRLNLPNFATNNVTFPNYTIIFNIIPVVDVR